MNFKSYIFGGIFRVNLNLLRKFLWEFSALICVRIFCVNLYFPRNYVWEFSTQICMGIFCINLCGNRLEKFRFNPVPKPTEGGYQAQHVTEL